MSRILHIIISSHFDEHTSSLCNSLLKEDDIIVIHIDAKCAAYSIPHDLLYHPNLVVTQPRIKVNRGDYSIVEAIMHSYNMCNELLTENDYVNILSGEDYPVRPLTHLRSFLLENHGKSFLNFIEVPVKVMAYHNGAENSNFIRNCDWPFATEPSFYFDRMRSENYAPSEYYNEILKQRSPFKFKLPIARKLYNFVAGTRTYTRMMVPLRKRNKYPRYEFYGGSAWFTLPKPAMDHVLSFLQDEKNSDLIRFFKKMKHPDEFVFQTILVNSGNFQIVNSDLRYLDWRNASDMGRPAYIDESDIPKIEQSNAFFCRKVNHKGVRLIKNSKWMRQYE